MSRIHPSIRGFLIAPIVASVPVTIVLDGSVRYFFEAWLIVLPITYASALVIGAPVYLLLRRKIAYTALNLGSAGAFVALLAFLAVLFPYIDIALDMALFHLGIGLCGFFGGLTFWFLTKEQSAN